MASDETDRWRQRSGELAPSPPCLKELVSPDKIIWLFSRTPGGDMPFTWRGPVSMRLHVCVLITSTGKRYSASWHSNIKTLIGNMGENMRLSERSLTPLYLIN